MRISKSWLENPERVVNSLWNFDFDKFEKSGV